MGVAEWLTPHEELSTQKKKKPSKKRGKSVESHIGKKTVGGITVAENGRRGREKKGLQDVQELPMTEKKDAGEIGETGGRNRVKEDGRAALKGWNTLGEGKKSVEEGTHRKVINE